MHKNSFLLALCVTAWLWVLPAVSSAAEPAEQPNILLLFVDDLGWSNLGYRDARFETPNIDQLAADGLDFERCYIASPTCSPSRATLVTGQHPARLKMVRHIPHGPKFGGDAFGRTDQPTHLWPTDPANFPTPNWLALEHTTYAEALKGLGYYNLFVGKWHLGHEPYHPIHQGFDRQIGTTNWGHPKGYYPPFFKQPNVFKDETERYLTQVLTDETISFIEDHDGQQPFMISLWYYNVHNPLQGPKEDVAYFKSKGLDKKQANYAAMVKAVDRSVGRLRKALEDKGIADDTLIVFLSDQGSFFDAQWEGDQKLRGGKRVDTLGEGGARVPFYVYWPGVTRPASKNMSLVQSTDLLPTLVEIAGGDQADFADLDGVSLLPTIRANTLLERGDPIYGYRAYQDLYATVREGDWKLWAYRSGEKELYNLAQDIGEQKNVASEYSEIVEKLVKKLAVWELEVGVEEYSGVQ